MKNIKELRKSLAANYSSIKSGRMKLPIAKQLSETAGKILDTCKVEIEYNKHLGQKKKIDFLENK